MTRDALIAQLTSLRPDLEAEGVSHIALFGSRARGDGTEGSDIDVLVEPAPTARFSILSLIGVEHLISDATGIPANAFMRRSLDKEFTRLVSQDIVEIF